MELYEEIKNNPDRFDMFFLDIDMPQMTGIELAQNIRAINQNVIICFVTSEPNYTSEAFGVDAIGYIDKPIMYPLVKKVLNHAKIPIYYKQDEELARKRFITVKISRMEVEIDSTKILYIEKRRNQSVIVLTDIQYFCYQTLRELKAILDPEIFFYCHQGYIVNYNQILLVSTNSIRVNGNVEIPLSRKYSKEMKAMFNDKIYHMRRV